jgi:hypothetical protein
MGSPLSIAFCDARLPRGRADAVVVDPPCYVDFIRPMLEPPPPLPAGRVASFSSACRRVELGQALRRTGRRPFDSPDGSDSASAITTHFPFTTIHRSSRPTPSLLSASTRRSAGVGATSSYFASRYAPLAPRCPSTPAAAKRSCQRHTVVIAVPVAAITAFVPSPSAVRRTIRARQTCFWAAIPIGNDGLEPPAIGGRDRDGIPLRRLVTRMIRCGRESL